MGDTEGTFFIAAPGLIPVPDNSTKLTLFRSTVDNQYYVKKSDGTIENFTVGITGLMQLIGSWDASVNLFPSTGGSGASGSIQAGDTWVISVAGTLGGTAVEIGDVIIAKVDNPGQVPGNWIQIEHNFGYVPENSANKATNYSIINDILYPSIKATNDRFSVSQKTGTVLAFTQDAFYGTIGAPETGNITADVTGARLGCTLVVIHNNVAPPTFGPEFSQLSSSSAYVNGSVNYIFITFVNSTTIIYSIQQ